MLTVLLKIQPGITAVIGSGGKTSLLRVLGEELAAAGHRVVLTATTKIYPFEGLMNLENPSEEDIAAALEYPGIVCVGTPVPGSGKLTAPSVPLDRLGKAAEFILVEADGSAQRPLKAHAPYEPVIPEGTDQIIGVVGISGLGLPVREAAHRSERYAELAGVSLGTPVTPELAARVLSMEHLADRYFLNQADTPERWEWARRLAAQLDVPAAAGSLQKGVYVSCG